MFPARFRRFPVRAKAVTRRSESASESQQLLLPLILAFALALALAWPHHVHAQGAAASVTASSAGTHTVRPGETLWGLAARYYGDGHKWRDLAALNGLSDGGERGISVGQTLRVPTDAPSLAASRAARAAAPPREAPATAVKPAAGTPAPAPAEEPAPMAAPVVTPTPEPVAAPTPAPTPAPTLAPTPAPVTAAAPLAADAPAMAPMPSPFTEPVRGTLMGEEEREARGPVRIGLVRRVDLINARGRDNTTIFLGPAPFDADTMQGTISFMGTESLVAPATRRPGEFEAAPFALSASEWKAAGVVNRRAQSSAPVKSNDLQRMQQRDLVEITVPGDAPPQPGTKLVSAISAADLGGSARLVIPTGILTVEAPRNGRTVARVTRLFGVIEQGQALLPFVDAPEAAVAGTVDSLETQVRWITEKALLPSLQSYLVLSTAAEGVIAVGDRFELVASSATQSRVALVRVVRVGPEGATAIITQQEQPSIREGMRARRIGHAP